MTTPTREQVIQWARELGIIPPHPYVVPTDAQLDAVRKFAEKLQHQNDAAFDELRSEIVRLENELAAAQAVIAGKERFGVPDRVIEQLWQHAGVSTYHQDGDQSEKKLRPVICAAMQKTFDAIDLPQREGYPAGWAKVTLMVSPDGKEVHATGGDREPGDGDTLFIGLERMQAAGMLTPN